MIELMRVLRLAGLMVLAFHVAGLMPGLALSLAHAQINDTVSVEARARDNPQSNPADIEGGFTKAPDGFQDEIRVTNDGVKGKGAGVYNDPVNDGATLTIVQESGPVVVSVDGREGVGAIYWVEVGPDSAGKGRGGKRPDLVADVSDLEVTLMLRDTVSGQELFDHTNTDADTGTLVCWPRDKTGFAEFQLLVSYGTFDWAISGDGIEYRGMLSATNNWTDAEGELPPGRYQLVVSNGGIRRRIDFIVYGVRIDFVDANFAPSVERLTIKYSILPEGFSVDRAWLEISRSTSKETLIFSDATIARSGTQVDYVQDGAAGWDGKGSDGKWVSPLESGYFIQVKASMEDGRGTTADAKDTAVEIHSLTVNKPEDAKDEELRVIMNDPNHAEEIAVTVKVKDKGGDGVVTEVPIDVEYGFSDPGEANTPKDDSYEYAQGKFLGKAGDPTAIHWADHPKSASESDDHYKLTCRATTIVAQGADQGKAYISFKPSGVGGDNFQLEASVKHKNGNVLKAAKSGVLTVWRQVFFDNIYEMAGVNHVSEAAAEESIQLFFSEAFVEYKVGPVKRIPAEKSVKYLGLWKDDGDHQKNWAEIRKQREEVHSATQFGPDAGTVIVTTEVPAAEEVALADAGNVEARKSITLKAQAWVERIDSDRFHSEQQWLKSGGVPSNALVGIQFYHPKYNFMAAEFFGPDWPDWVRVVANWGGIASADPGRLWEDTQGRTYGSIATISEQLGPDQTRLTVVHEVGHATKGPPVKQFYRRKFGNDDDHSEAAGLMDTHGTRLRFSASEVLILRGIRP